jgi:hypothetical protein
VLKDITGETFGRLLVLRRAKRDSKHTYWLVRCECGRRKQIRADSLRDGSIRSCGCIPRGKDPENIEGQRFGRLVAVRRVGSTSCRASLWECRCRCGGVVTVRLDQLRDATTQSCGCWYRDSRRITNYRHGHARMRSKSATYRAYQREKSLCECPTNRHFKYYGGRDPVIEFRFGSFAEFYSAVGDKPGVGHGCWLERIDKDGHFEASNLHWIYKKKNRKKVKHVASSRY